MAIEFPANTKYKALVECLSTIVRLNFLRYLLSFSKGEGYGSEQGSVIFPSEFEPWEKEDEDYIETGVRVIAYLGVYGKAEEGIIECIRGCFLYVLKNSL